LRVTGPRGVISKNFKHVPVEIQKIKNKLTVTFWLGDRKQAATVRTIYSKINNMIKGVTKV
jgi:large subunit ribosomal protein L9e